MVVTQQEGPVIGDLALLVENDLKNLKVTKAQVEAPPRINIITGKAQLSETFEFQQPYLINPNIYLADKRTLTSIRSQCVRNVKINFSKMYKFRLSCPLQCKNKAPQPAGMARHSNTFGNVS